MPMWYHFNCFFKKAKITATHEIKGYDCLRYEDQQRIKVKLGLETNQDETASTSATSATASTSTATNQTDVNIRQSFWNFFNLFIYR